MALEQLLLRGAETAEMRAALLAYCGLDTLAMVEIVKRLRGMVQGATAFVAGSV